MGSAFWAMLSAVVADFEMRCMLRPGLLQKGWGENELAKWAAVNCTRIGGGRNQTSIKGTLGKRLLYLLRLNDLCPLLEPKKKKLATIQRVNGNCLRVSHIWEVIGQK